MIGIAALMLAILRHAAEFIYFYIMPALVVDAKVEKAVQGIMPVRPASLGFMKDEFGACEDNALRDEGKVKSTQTSSKGRGKRMFKDALTQAKRILKEADEDPTKVLQDSAIVYLSWFRYILSLRDVSLIAVVLIALFMNLFCGIDVKEWGLTETVESVLETFVPTIKKNRKRRTDGEKGAEYGSLGGRPKKDQNAYSQNPYGVKSETPTVTDLGTDNKKSLSVSQNSSGSGNLSENIPITAKGWDTAGGMKQKIYYAVLAVFFFRNLSKPQKQTEKFLGYYCAKLNSMKGRNDAETLIKWIQLAHSWEVLDDKQSRFETQDLDFWSRLYDIAPEQIKPAMLDAKISFIQEENGVRIVCSRLVAEWIEDNVDQTQPIIRSWNGVRNLGYKHPGE